MSRRITKNTNKDSKQPKLTAFINKSNERSSGIMKIHKILNVFVNVNLKSRIGKWNAKTIYFASAVPETETSSTSSEPHSSTSATVCTEGGCTIDSTTVNVTLNVTTDTEVAGK